MKTLVEKGFRQLFGMDVKMINRSDIDIAIYTMNKKLKKLDEKKLAELEPNFAIVRIGSGYDLWDYRLYILDDERKSMGYNDSVNTYNSPEQAFIGLMEAWFSGEILMKFMQRNVNE